MAKNNMSLLGIIGILVIGITVFFLYSSNGLRITGEAGGRGSAYVTGGPPTIPVNFPSCHIKLASDFTAEEQGLGIPAKCQRYASEQSGGAEGGGALNRICKQLGSYKFYYKGLAPWYSSTRPTNTAECCTCDE